MTDLFARLSVVCPFALLSVCPPSCLSVSLSVCPSVCLPAYLFHALCFSVVSWIELAQYLAKI
jgi:hypothetical protein